MTEQMEEMKFPLFQVGGLIDSKYFGIATPIGSPWRDRISLAILELQEKGVIQILYNKWWKTQSETCNRFEKGKDSKLNTLGVDSIGCYFQLFLLLLLLSTLMALLV